VWQFLSIENFSGDLGSFSCGETQDEKGLNDFLKLSARKFHGEGTSSVYLMVDKLFPSDVVGYFTLSNSLIPSNEVPDPFKEWISFDIPSVLIGKFALCKAYQGKKSEDGIKISQILATEAYRRILGQYNAKTIGFNSVRVDTQPSNQKALTFWTKQGFIPFRKTKRFLFLPVSHLSKYFE